MKKEKWKRIRGHKSYLISSWGRIFSLKSEKVLRPYIHKSRDNTYLRVEIDSKKYMVHVLVGLHFHFKQMNELQALFPEKELDVDHKDRNTLNCNENNLRWLTHSENISHFHETSKLKFNGKSYSLTKESKRF